MNENKRNQVLHKSEISATMVLKQSLAFIQNMNLHNNKAKYERV